MDTCRICGFEVANNRGGQLTNHLKKLHGMSLNDYVVQFQFLGIEPKCACGLCDERPVFKRGKFLTYALGHQSFDERERRYREKFGTPLCVECRKEVCFRRGEPKKFCSQRCSGKHAGFSLDKTQMKIREVVMLRYGVDNVSKLNDVRSKISKSHEKRIYEPASQSTRLKQSLATRRRWSNIDYRRKMSNIEYTTEERRRRSNWLKERNRDPDFRQKLFLRCKNRLSKLHQRIRSELGLDDLGFVSEQRVLKYFADELHEEKKVVLEVYGDYPHANPTKYSPNFIVKMPGQSYTACEKWEADDLRRKNIESAGYRVFIIWESDDLQQKKIELERFLML